MSPYKLRCRADSSGLRLTASLVGFSFVVTLTRSEYNVGIRELVRPIPLPAFHKSGNWQGHVAESGRLPVPGFGVSNPGSGFEELVTSGSRIRQVPEPGPTGQKVVVR